MLTIDFDLFDLRPGHRVLDLGCGDGRHAFAAQRRGAHVVALDLDGIALKGVHDTLEPSPAALTVRGDGTALPVADGAFDRVIVSEVLEHIPDDQTMLHAAARALTPGGLLAVSVPRWFPERVCWALSTSYHQVDGGHIRIYRRNQLLHRIHRAGLHPIATHHAHGLHSPYWWLRCLVGIDRETPLVRAYHDLLCREIVNGPWPTRRVARALDTIAGKSLVVYARKPA